MALETLPRFPSSLPLSSFCPFRFVRAVYTYPVVARRSNIVILEFDDFPSSVFKRLNSLAGPNPDYVTTARLLQLQDTGHGIPSANVFAVAHGRSLDSYHS